jgi:hypothetical protein
VELLLLLAVQSPDLGRYNRLHNSYKEGRNAG